MNKGDITEEECKETVAAVIEELHNLVVGVRPMLRRLGSRHPLISKVTDLKTLLVNNALTVNLEEKEICVALLEEFLLTEANTDIAATAPKLTNGEKKICSLNAAFPFLLKLGYRKKTPCSWVDSQVPGLRKFFGLHQKITILGDRLKLCCGNK